MANNRVQVKRTTVSGRTPNTTGSYATNSQYISAGELALNMADGILYSSNGSAVIEVGANNTNARVTGNLTVKGIIANGGLGASGQVLSSNGSATYWADSSGVGGTTARVYQSYTATDGQTVFAVSGGYTNNFVDVFYNGVHLANNEYTQDGSNITLTQAANGGALVEVSGYLVNGTITSSSVWGGTNTQINFNDSNTLGASANLTFDKATTLLTVGNSSVNTQITPGNVFLNGSQLVVGNTASNVSINSTVIAIGSSLTINSTYFSGTANNADYVGGVTVASYVKNTDSRVLSGNLQFTGSNTQFDAGLTANTLTLAPNTYIDLSPTSNATSWKEGRFFYENFDKSLNIMTNVQDFTYQVGQKEFIRVWNDSGVTILKGQPVYITGYHNLAHQHPTVGLADASDPTKYNVVGLAGHDIANGSHGFVVSRGYIQYVNTANLTATSTFHLGFSAPGVIQTTAPQYPNYPTDLGICILSDAANGVLYVDIAQHTVEQFRVLEDVHVGGTLSVEGDLNITGNVISTSATNIATSENIMYLASGDTITTTNFTGSGLNDAEFHGVYEGGTANTYYVKIDSTGTPDTFAWSKDNFATTIASSVAITGAFQALANGISIQFQATTGHTLNDKWDGSAAPVNVDLGWAGNYNDGTYQHAGLFRDASDGIFKVFEGYLPEPSSNVNIDTANSSFRFAAFKANNIFVGNATVSSTINSTSFTGSANNATYLNGVAASSYVNTTGNFTLTGNNTFAGTNTTISSNLNITGTFINVASAFVVNSTGAYHTGTVNAASLTVGTGDFIANSLGVHSNSNINLTVNNTRYTFTPLAGGSNTYFTQQNDDNFVFYSTNTSNQPRAIWSVFANSVTSNLNINVPLYPSAGIVARASSATSVTSPLAWNSDNTDQIAYTALANDLTINADSGNPIDGQKMIFRFKDNATPRTVTFTTGASKAFRAIGTTIPITTTASKTVYVGCIYHATDARWDIVAISAEA